MTSKLTRERIQRIIRAIDSEAYDEEEIREWLSSDEIMELSRIALAAMDSSESVELPIDYLQGHKDGLEWAAQLAEANHPETGDWLYDDPIELAKAIRKGPDMPTAQPAPVVPELMVDWQENEFSAGWNACRAAMLAAAPQPQSAQQNIPEIIPGWIPVSERMPDCWCRTCRPVAINDMRFVVCPDFGNKRCPRANDHRNACTGSNETGQEGSAYPAAPQEVKGE
ncbi:hypothetical protein [Klebsiella pneumoniae]|uniref:hypothetical protein n=1 Tax=Klebsiella pneumoniae TaxID=573 RepID=UPI001FAD22CD|nr:hypothetical protein [Klebsiella pneumoniae]